MLLGLSLFSGVCLLALRVTLGLAGDPRGRLAAGEAAPPLALAALPRGVLTCGQERGRERVVVSERDGEW